MSALLVWALAAASAVFWGMRGFAAGRPVPLGTQVASTAPVASNGPLTRVLGAAPVAVQAPEEVVDTRFKLLGVVAPKRAGERGGVALIAVDDQPPKHYRVGAHIEGGDAVLLAVHSRGAELGPRGGPASVQLELPDPESAPRSSMPASPPPGRPAAAGVMQPPPGQMAPGMAPHQQQIMPVRPQMPAPQQVPQQPPQGQEEEEEE